MLSFTLPAHRPFIGVFDNCSYCTRTAATRAMAEPRVTETGVPIDHLDYTYVRNCKNTKEVEKILRVLRYDYTTCTCSVCTVHVRVCKSYCDVIVGVFL